MDSDQTTRDQPAGSAAGEEITTTAGGGAEMDSSQILQDDFYIA